MPWNQTTPMDQKTQFVADYRRKTFSFTEQCARYAVSRETGYKSIRRYLVKGNPKLPSCGNRILPTRFKNRLFPRPGPDQL
jgi:hypothetical protein